jgi:hypothetical protein
MHAYHAVRNNLAPLSLSIWPTIWSDGVSFGDVQRLLGDTFSALNRQHCAQKRRHKELAVVGKKGVKELG